MSDLALAAALLAVCCLIGIGGPWLYWEAVERRDRQAWREDMQRSQEAWEARIRSILASFAAKDAELMAALVKREGARWPEEQP